jgi:7-cyano-7-deazaguanine synthase
MTLYPNTLPQNKKYGSVVLLSGGLDSYLTLQYAMEHHKKFSEENPILCLSFQYGQKHIVENAVARAISSAMMLDHMTVVLNPNPFFIESALITGSGKEVQEGPYPDEGTINTFIPNRNLLMLTYASMAAHYLDADAIWIGVHQGDRPNYPDCRGEFLEDAEDAINSSLGRDTAFTRVGNILDIISPLINKSKTEIVKKLAYNAGDFSSWDFRKTISCYNAEWFADYSEDNASIEYKITPCLKCPTCLEREAAMNDNDIFDTKELCVSLDYRDSVALKLLPQKYWVDSF